MRNRSRRKHQRMHSFAFVNDAAKIESSAGSVPNSTPMRSQTACASARALRRSSRFLTDGQQPRIVPRLRYGGGGARLTASTAGSRGVSPRRQAE